MKRIITIILMCLPFVAFGQTTDYVDRLIKTDEYEIIAGSIYYKELLEFNTLDEVFEFIGNSPKEENARIIEDKELGIVSYKELDVVRTVSVYGMTFEASCNELTYRPEREDYFGFKDDFSVEEAREAYKVATSANAAKEYLRYLQPTEEELRAILKAVKEDCAPNSEIKKTTIGGEVRNTILITDIYQIGNYKINKTTIGGMVRNTILSVDIYQIGNYKIEVTKSDGINLITICTR